MRCFAGTDVGRFRKTNQDFPFASAEAVGPLPNLFMVADGMGGHKAGDYASRFIVEQVNKNLKELPEGTKPVSALKRAIEQANADLYSESLKDPEKEGMVHMAGMAALMTLMLFVLFNDIRNLM